MVREDRLDLLALCAIDGVTGTQWEVIAREASRSQGLSELLQGIVREQTPTAAKLRDALRQGLDQLSEARGRARTEVEAAKQVDARLVTVLDDEYPITLRRIPNLPPFVFVQGELLENDARSLAVVGTRRASETGLQQAAKMARLLVAEDVTVVSGMAEGIDTAAHEAAIDAGGRTIAVMGTGIRRTYPKHNEELRQRIVNNGAVISQFWPRQPPGRHTFPIRNVVTSGVSQGTVVIEASSTSGARHQARRAWEHGKQVFLIRSLVMSEDWATMFVEEGRAVQVDDPGDVASIVRRLQRPEELRDAASLRDQLALELA